MPRYSEAEGFEPYLTADEDPRHSGYHQPQPQPQQYRRPRHRQYRPADPGYDDNYDDYNSSNNDYIINDDGTGRVPIIRHPRSPSPPRTRVARPADHSTRSSEGSLGPIRSRGRSNPSHRYSVDSAAMMNSIQGGAGGGPRVFVPAQFQYRGDPTMPPPPPGPLRGSRMPAGERDELYRRGGPVPPRTRAGAPERRGRRASSASPEAMRVIVEPPPQSASAAYAHDPDALLLQRSRSDRRPSERRVRPVSVTYDDRVNAADEYQDEVAMSGAPGPRGRGGGERSGERESREPGRLPPLSRSAAADQDVIRTLSEADARRRRGMGDDDRGGGGGGRGRTSSNSSSTGAAAAAATAAAAGVAAGIASNYALRGGRERPHVTTRFESAAGQDTDDDDEATMANEGRGRSRTSLRDDRPLLRPKLVPLDEVRGDPVGDLAEKSLRDTPDERERLRFHLSSPAVSFSPSVPSRGSASSIPTVIPSTAFEYRKIEGTQFRLLRILPESMLVVKCSIVYSSLDADFKYTAISYSWGDKDETAEIQVDGHKLTITASLYGALKRLRKQRESVMVWADAVCINQNDKEELSQQVRMMPSIFLQAESVAIWLGPEADDSDLAIELVRRTAKAANSSSAMRDLIASPQLRRHFTALVALFEREYWRRLWVVQEVLNAASKTVYCGQEKLPWEMLTTVSAAFSEHTQELNYHFPLSLSNGTQLQLTQPSRSYARVLSQYGPASFQKLTHLRDGEPRSLLDALHACRTKLSADPRDKVFGLLGILPDEVRNDFPIDYAASVREVYTDVVDFLLHSDGIDVICEAIYFPLHTGNTSLPSWVPDWSHIPQSGALGLTYDFAASANTKAEFTFIDRRRKLRISALPLDTVLTRGIAVGTLCGLEDFLMAFLHWRAKLFGSRFLRELHGDRAMHDAFCRTLRLGQESPRPRRRHMGDEDDDDNSDEQYQLPPSSSRWRKKGEWTRVCYHVFASLLLDRLPHIPLDDELREYAEMGKELGIEPGERRSILQDSCASKMMGRSFFITKNGLMGLGTGFMDPGDAVCIPLGCSTPVLLRAEGAAGEYRFVGDCYVDRYMDGQAFRGGAARDKKQAYVLH